jgi:tetratricopeptide (TPR) repeat protein
MTEPPAPPPQIVQNVIAIGGFAYGAVHGDLHVYGDGRPVYTIEEYRAGRQPPLEWLLQLPSRMLDARHGIVEFTGREAELSRLSEWRDDSSRLSVMFLHAPGGQGQTRLAARFAELSIMDGWKVLTARHGGDTITAPDGSQDLSAGDAKGLVLIVDYADRWPHSHLEWLLRNRLLHTPVPTRVLLLARSAGGWPALQHTLEEVYASTADLALSPLDQGQQDRRTLFEQARERFGALFGLPAGVVPAPSALDDPSFELILALHMAALVAVDAHARGEIPPRDPAQLTAYLLRREHAHWTRLFSRAEHGADFQTPPEIMAQAAFTATIAGAMPQERADALLESLAPAEKWSVAATRIRADHLVCYPASEAGVALEPLLPDRLAEDYLALNLHGHTVTGYAADPWAPEATLRLLTEAPMSVAPRAVTFLAAAAERWPHVGSEHLFPMLRQRPEIGIAAGGLALTAVAELPEVDINVLEAIEPLLPPGRHTDLDRATVAVVKRLTRHRLAVTAEPAERAGLLVRLGTRLTYVDSYHEAMAASGEAVELLRGLDPSARVAHLAELAEALHLHSGTLAALGDIPRGLALLPEAVEIRARLAESDHRKYGPDLALSVAQLSAQLLYVGRRGEAAAAAQRAVELWRELAADGPVEQASLASSLSILGERLQRIERLGDGVAATAEAVSLMRPLAQAEPARYEPRLRDALMQHGYALERVAEHASAVDVFRESIAIERRLAELNPATFLPGLASSLAGMSVSLRETGAWAEALSAATEAVEIQRSLVATSPRMPRGPLANSLTAMVLAANGAGLPAQARAAAEEALVLYRDLVATQPSVHSDGLATALDAAAIGFAAAGQFDRALDANLEAVRLRRRLAETKPEIYEAELATALGLLGTRLAEMGRFGESVLAHEESLDINLRLAERRPEAYLPQVVRSLGDLAVSFDGLGRWEDSLAATQRSIHMLRSWPSANPDVQDSGLAIALSNYAVGLNDRSRRDEAIAAGTEALQCARRAAGNHPAAYDRDLASVLRNLGVILADADRAAEGRPLLTESVSIWRRLAAANPAAFDLDLARALGALAQALSKLDLIADAVLLAEEGVELLRRLRAGNPLAIEPVLAVQLSSLWQIRMTQGVSEELLRTMSEHRDLLEILTARNEALYGADLHATLMNLGGILFQVGRPDQALPCFGRAVELDRHRQRPDQPKTGVALGLALNAFGAAAGQLGQAGPALAATTEAVAVLRAIGRPEADPALSNSLSNLVQSHLLTGNIPAALAAQQELTPVLERLDDPTGPASSLLATVQMLSQLARWPAAQVTAAEATAAWRRLAAGDPAVEQYLANARQLEAVALSQVGDTGQAIAAATEAVEIWRRVAVADPPQLFPVWAQALTTLAQISFPAGQVDRAAEALAEAAAVLRQLGDDATLATTLLQLCRCLSVLGRYPEMVEAARECVAIRRRLAAGLADLLPDLISALRTLASALALAGVADESLALSEEAVALADSLRSSTLDSTAVDLATATARQTFAWVRGGLEQDLERALPAAKEAVAVLRALHATGSPAYAAPLQDALSTLAEVERLLAVAAAGQPSPMPARAPAIADPPAAAEADTAIIADPSVAAEADTARLVPPVRRRRPWWRRIFGRST